MSHPKSHESQPLRPPRRPLVAFVEAELPPDVLALLRMTWFARGRPGVVEEFAVYCFEGGPLVIQTAINQAAVQGFDLTVASDASPQDLGLCEC